MELRSEPVELGELSRAVLAEFELGTTERGIATALDDRGGSVWALGDPAASPGSCGSCSTTRVGVSPGGQRGHGRAAERGASRAERVRQGPGSARRSAS